MTDKEIVSASSLAARINRKLVREGLALKTARDDTMELDKYGRYYVVERHSGDLADRRVDLEKFGRELGALHPHERLADSRT